MAFHLQIGIEYLILIIVFLIIMYIVQSVMSYRRERQALKQVEIPYKYVTVIKCLSNDFTTERDFHEGDFIGKIIGKCPKCGNKLEIASIYTLYTNKNARSSRSS